MLDRQAVQSLVLHPHRAPFSRHFFLRFTDQDGAKRFIGGRLPSIADGTTDLGMGDRAYVNLAVSWTGLCALGAFDTLGGIEQARDAFPSDFTDPTDAISVAAFGSSSPDNWWEGRFATADIHATLHLYCDDAERLDAETELIRRAAQDCEVDELKATPDGPISGQVLGRDRAGLRKLHFGYSDGFSQPEIDWDNEATDPNLYPRGRFMIDAWEEDAQSFPRRDPWRGLVRHSSYLALAWMYQDVALFNRFLRENASRVAPPGMSPPDAQELLAAKMMGRWRDGTPLMLSPDCTNPDLAVQDFAFESDPQGLRCPISSHIRIMNGRDQSLDAVNRVLFKAGFPRVIRRGASYGPPLDGEIDDGVDRGILGMFICANVKKQFYFLMRWIGRTDFSDAFADQRGQDPLFASRDVPDASRSMTIPSPDGSVALGPLPQFVRQKGIAIMLLPSLPLLRHLVGDA